MHALLGSALVTTVVASLGVGAAGVAPSEVARTLASHLGADVEPLSPLRDSLVWQLRIPRVLMAAVVGATLAVCGAVLQALTRNALAEPYLLGISSGASAGAVAVVILGLGAGVASMTTGAFVGAVVAFTSVLLLLVRTRLASSTRVVLTGVAVGQFFSSVTSLVLIWSGDAESTRGITHWLLGSMTGARWDVVVLGGAATVVGLALCWALGPALDALAFGDDAASSLGIPVRAVRWSLLLCTAMLTATVVAAVGAIGFVGLIVPHAVRALAGSTHRRLLPLSALGGSTFLVAADAVSRTAFAPEEIPVGVVTALVGVPAFLVLIRRRSPA